jgi:hypothetical protein
MLEEEPPTCVILSIHSRKTAIRDVMTSPRSQLCKSRKTRELRGDVMESPDLSGRRISAVVLSIQRGDRLRIRVEHHD